MDIIERYRKQEAAYICVAAPMVRYSKLPFRLLVRELGVDLAHTPMIMADAFLASQKARDMEFTTCLEDRPLIVQLASNDPCEFSLVTEMLAPYCDGVDLNCGCPQRWAMQSGLGSALLRKPEKIADLVRSARHTTPRWRVPPDSPDSASSTNEGNTLRRIKGPFSISAKLRIVPPGSRACGSPNSTQLNNTVELVRRLASMGVDWVTLHARTPEQRSGEPACWDLVRELVETRVTHFATGGTLPIILNGDVRTVEEANQAHQLTGCQGVMVARGLLSNPTLFRSTWDPRRPSDLRKLLNRWIYLSARYPTGNCFENLHSQTYWMMEHHLDRTRRFLLHSVNSFAGLCDWLQDYWELVCDA